MAKKKGIKIYLLYYFLCLHSTYIYTRYRLHFIQVRKYLEEKQKNNNKQLTCDLGTNYEYSICMVSIPKRINFSE